MEGHWALAMLVVWVLVWSAPCHPYNTGRKLRNDLDRLGAERRDRRCVHACVLGRAPVEEWD